MNFLPITKKELRSYFYSPIAYVLLASFLFLCGFFFYVILSSFSNQSQMAMRNPQAILNVTEHVIRPLLGNITIIILFMIPFLTMRLFSEEKKSGTFELIMTYPIKDIEVVLGKITACGSIYLIMLLFTLPYSIFLMIYSKPDIAVIATGYLGLLLLGLSFISLGAFISSLTENQIIAGVAGLGLNLILWIVGWVSSVFEGNTSEIISQFSLLKHYDSFSKGVIDLSDIIYYLSFIAFSIFITLRSLESKRWRS